MSEFNSATLIYPMNKEFQSRNIQNYIFYLLIFVNFPTLDFLLVKIKEREFKKYFCHSVLYFYTNSFFPIFFWEKKYFQQRHEKSTCKIMPIVGGFVYFLLLDLIEVLRHKSPLEMTNFGDPNNCGNGSTTNFFSIGGTKKTE